MNLREGTSTFGSLCQLPNLLTGVNERPTKHLSLSGSQHSMVISASAPTLTICEDNKEAFYENLKSLVKSTPASDKIILLRHFNARIGSYSGGSKGVFGPPGPQKMSCSY